MTSHENIDSVINSFNNKIRKAPSKDRKKTERLYNEATEKSAEDRGESHWNGTHN